MQGRAYEASREAQFEALLRKINDRRYVCANSRLSFCDTIEVSGKTFTITRTRWDNFGNPSYIPWKSYDGNRNFEIPARVFRLEFQNGMGYTFAIDEDGASITALWDNGYKDKFTVE